MQPIQIGEIPDEIGEYLKNINSIKFPRQGYTSDVGIIHNHQGSYVLKRTKGEWFCSLLKREVSVLNCLAKETKLLIPKVKLFVEQKQNSQCWALLEFLQGETIRLALKDEKNKETSQEIIFNAFQQKSPTSIGGEMNAGLSIFSAGAQTSAERS
ncbi:hypothetical protein ACQKNB_17130 [Lysinibacillus xylanilyticus]|uniref:hypothetical protein n=1 Tax=Lysinibacillus xylanilyticus TaxID=582475 RepID=UPI003CFD8846